LFRDFADSLDRGPQKISLLVTAPFAVKEAFSELLGEGVLFASSVCGGARSGKHQCPRLNLLFGQDFSVFSAKGESYAEGTVPWICLRCWRG
jgi:hypothetical protein